MGLCDICYGITDYGPYRHITSVCIVDKLFVYNNRFDVSFTPIFPFLPPSTNEDQIYRTVYGPSFAHPGLIYGNCNSNINHALTRLLNKREPSILGFHEKLCSNQREFILSHWNSVYISHLRTCFASDLFDFDFLDHLVEFSNRPHVKKKLRIIATSQVLDSGSAFIPLWHHEATGKLKRDEIAKQNGIPRLIVDLTCPASLRCGDIIDILKTRFADNPYITSSCYISFIKASTFDRLKHVFTTLHDFDGFVGFFHSDDITCKIKGMYYNIDISKCDLSHMPILFNLFLSLVPSQYYIYIKYVILQLTLPMTVYGQDGDKYLLRPLEPILYSGSVLTTIINSLASYLLCFSLSQFDIKSVDDIQTCCNSVGYQVTVQPCSCFQFVQFLKHSPMYDVHGVITPVINVGVILRLLGRCRGDLPGRGAIVDRAYSFQQSLVRCFYNTPRYSFLNLLIHKYCVTADVLAANLDTYFMEGYSVHSEHYIPDEQFCLRYDLTHSQWHELLHFVSIASFGDIIYCEASDRVLYIDYSLGF